MAWTPGLGSGGGVWRSLAVFSAKKKAQTSFQTPIAFNGALAFTLADATLVAASTVVTVSVPRTGALASTLAGATLASASQLAIKAALAVTTDNTTLTAYTGPLQQPTISAVSASGASPVVLAISDGDYVAGKRLHWEFASSLTPTKNSDGSYTTPSQSGVTFIDGDSWARLDLALNYADPSGAFSFHCRVLRDNENGVTTVTSAVGSASITANYDASAWSSDYSDTITQAAAKLNSGNGTNKSRYLNVASPFYQWITNNNVGAICATRATIPAANTKFHAEFTADHFNQTGGNSKFGCGFDDGTPNLNSTGFLTGSQAAGASGVSGLTLWGAKGSNAMTFWRNGAQSSLTLPVTLTDGDTIAFDVDTSAHTVRITHYRGGAATVLNGGSAVTLTAGIPSSWYAFGAGGAGVTNGTALNSDAGTFNPGSSANLVTPQVGYGIYA